MRENLFRASPLASDGLLEIFGGPWHVEGSLHPLPFFSFFFKKIF